MPAKKPARKKSVSPVVVKAAPKAPRSARLKRVFMHRYQSYLARRPHRSFLITRRRDYRRSLELPGYWSFTAHVWRTLVSHKRLFGMVALAYALAGMAFVGLASQNGYNQLSQLLDETGTEIFTGGWGTVGQAGLLVLSGISGGLNTELTDAQQIIVGIIFLLTWLTTVWLLRGILAGSRPRFRDGLYNAGAPIVSTGVVMGIALLQLLPATLGIIAMNAAVGTNLFESGFMSMVVSITVALLVLLSIYLVTSSIFALIIVTLPGMYPLKALQTSGDLVIGRRIRLLLRFIWLAAGNLVFTVLVVLIAVLLDRAMKNVIPFFEAVPFVPLVISAVGALVTVWSATYVYLLYRKVVEDDAAPA